MSFKELYKIVSKVDKVLRYREPHKVDIIDNKVIITLGNSKREDVIFKGEQESCIEVLEALKVIDELVPLIKNIY